MSVLYLVEFQPAFEAPIERVALFWTRVPAESVANRRNAEADQPRYSVRAVELRVRTQSVELELQPVDEGNS